MRKYNAIEIASHVFDWVASFRSLCAIGDRQTDRQTNKWILSSFKASSHSVGRETGA